MMRGGTRPVGSAIPAPRPRTLCALVQGARRPLSTPHHRSSPKPSEAPTSMQLKRSSHRHVIMSYQ
jgi:hypothetical protein